MKFLLQVATSAVLIFLSAYIKEATCMNQTQAELSLIDALESSLLAPTPARTTHNATKVIFFLIVQIQNFSFSNRDLVKIRKEGFEMQCSSNNKNKSFFQIY